MNKARRSNIIKSNKRLQLVIELLEQYKRDIEMIQMEEEEAFDNLPESFQDGSKGDTMQEAIDEMEDAIGEIDSIVKNIEDIKTSLSVL